MVVYNIIWAAFIFINNKSIVVKINALDFSIKKPTIPYNQFNLPSKITIPGKGDITYLYDAAGRKLEKRTHILKDSTRNNVEITATTAYISGYIYQDNKLSFFGHEEGRIRVKDSTLNPQLSAAFVYDYFLKDHLGNIRTVLTDEQKQDNYPAATMELAHAATDTALYSNVTNTRSDKPPGYPTDTAYSNPNNKVAKLDGANNKIGPGITLKVMAGDKFNIRVSSWYRKNNVTPANPANPLTDLLAALAAGVSGPATAGGHGTFTATALNNSGVLPPGATQFLNNQTYNSDKPKAYLNWIVFDEHFKYDSLNSGFEQVGDDTILTIHTRTDLTVNKNGYLYVYVSNVTGNIPVFFDNLQVTHTRGPLLEEDHYYPFGLQMKGICSKAADGVENKFKFNGGGELDGDFGVDIYETFFRGYDAQIRRFRSVDPKARMTFSLSTFQFSGNNPVAYNDPLGDFFSYMDQNGNKWHGQDPLAGTAGGGIPLIEGLGSSDFGERGGGGGGGGSDFGYTITTAMVESFFRSSWMGTGRSNIHANEAEKGPNAGMSFNVGWSNESKGGGVVLGTQFYSYDKIAQLLGASINPKSIGNNLLGLSYPGGDNPKSYNGKDTYKYVPFFSAEYPAIGHDRRYNRLNISGFKGLFSDSRAIGADWRFVKEELEITLTSEGSFFKEYDGKMNSLKDLNGFMTIAMLDAYNRGNAAILGICLGLVALPKTLFTLTTSSNPGVEIAAWYYYSNIGVTNTPSH